MAEPDRLKDLESAIGAIDGVVQSLIIQIAFARFALLQLKAETALGTGKGKRG